MNLNVPPGSRVFLGAPAQPMQPALAAAVAGAVASIPGVIEAHLPQCYIPEIVGPAQVLVVVVLPGQVQRIGQKVADEISLVLSGAPFLDIWPVSLDDAVLSAVRGAGCKIFDASDKPGQSATAW